MRRSPGGRCGHGFLAAWLLAGVLVLVASGPGTAVAAPNTCGRPQLGGAITSRLVKAIRCNEAYIAGLFNAGNAGLKDSIPACKDQAAMPPDQQHWTLVEEDGANASNFADGPLKVELLALPALSGAITSSTLYYARHHDPANQYALVRAANRIEEGAKKWDGARINLATGGNSLTSHSCGAAETAEQDLNRYYAEGARLLNEANDQLTAIAKSK